MISPGTSTDAEERKQELVIATAIGKAKMTTNYGTRPSKRDDAFAGPRNSVPPRGATLRQSDLQQRRRNGKSGAGDEARTRDIFLGKEVLYQLSYTRIL